METVQPQAPAANEGYRYARNGAPADRRAMGALVASILGFMMFMPPLSIAAVIMSARGRKKEDIDQRSKMYYDLGLALGVVGLVLFIMMFAVMIFGGAASVMSEYYRK
jgi:ABC-type Na+ efflux pump permease subunit